MAGRGLLQIKLKSANDLYKHDLFGKQQPYCQVDCGKYRVKGKTCKDGGQDPTWNETLFFQISNETELLVTVFAEHQLSKDAAIGSAVISIVQVRQTVAEEASVPVMLKGKQAGTLHVALEFKGPTLTTFGQVGQIAPGGADPAGGRRALQGRRPGIYGASASFTPGTSHAGAQAQPLRFASMPVRFLQQGVAGSGGSFIAAQQQQAGATPFATHFTGSGGGISPSSSLVQPVPLGQQQSAADATAEARELLLQRQLSSPVMPADMATLQQMYSQQLQQLQMMQTQLLGNLPPELQQQQQMMQLQQQLLAQMTRAQSGGSQQDATQQTGASSGAGDVARSGSSGSAGLQLPRQPRHTAADLFRPDSSSYTHTGFPSSSGTSLQQLLETDRLLDEDSDVPSVPFSFDVGRLQAIIAKVYPDSSGVSSASIAALQVQHQQQHQQQQQRREVGLTAGERCRAAAPAGASPATYKQQQQHGVSVPPNSIGAFGAAAALAAAAAAGISFDANAGGNNNSSSISSMYGGFGGAAGSAAAAAALGSTHHSSDQLGQAAPPVANTSRSAATLNAANNTSAASGGVSGGAGDLTATQLTTVQSAGACSSTSSKLDRTSQQLIESSPSSTSAQSAPPVLVGSPQCEQLTGSDSQPLPVALSAPAEGTLQSLMDQQQQQQLHQQQQTQQVLLPPDMAAVVAEELNRMRMAAPVLAQLLGLGSISQQQSAGAAAAAGSMPEAAATLDSSRVVELERQLVALQREKTYLSTVLQEREQHTQQLYSQLAAQQQEISELRMMLTQQQQQQQQR